MIINAQHANLISNYRLEYKSFRLLDALDRIEVEANLGYTRCLFGLEDILNDNVVPDLIKLGFTVDLNYNTQIAEVSWNRV